MSSTISANISAAASKAVQNPQAQAAQQHARVPDANAVAQASQSNARSQSAKPKDDKKRDIQTTKRTEAGFAPRIVKPNSAPVANEQEAPDDSGTPKVEKVDVVA